MQNGQNWISVRMHLQQASCDLATARVIQIFTKKNFFLLAAHEVEIHFNNIF